MARDILHCDYNSFYASVEIYLNPNLKGKAIAVCGDVENRHGIVLAKSEMAKKAGVSTGEAVWQAKNKCPDLLVVPPHYDAYLYFSKIARKVYSHYTDKIQPFGMDECWLDITGSTKLYGSPEKIAHQIRNTMRERIGLTVSVGVSFNKIFAKLGSDMKKPDAVTVIPKESFREHIWNLPASDMLGVGRATEKNLHRYAINTIGDIANMEPDWMKRRFGVNGVLLWRYANGLDDSPVDDYSYKAPIKSIGHGMTCTRDLVNNNDVWRIIYELTTEISDKLRDNNLMSGGIQISVRDKDLGMYQFQHQLFTPTQSVKDIAFSSQELFEKRYEWKKPIRSITIRAINLLSSDMPVQMDFNTDYNQKDKNEKIELAMKNIRKRFGKDSIKFASLCDDLPLPKCYSNGVTMPTGMQR